MAFQAPEEFQLPENASQDLSWVDGFLTHLLGDQALMQGVTGSEPQTQQAAAPSASLSELPPPNWNSQGAGPPAAASLPSVQMPSLQMPPAAAEPATAMLGVMDPLAGMPQEMAASLPTPGSVPSVPVVVPSVVPTAQGTSIRFDTTQVLSDQARAAVQADPEMAKALAPVETKELRIAQLLTPSGQSLGLKRRYAPRKKDAEVMPKGLSAAEKQQWLRSRRLNKNRLASTAFRSRQQRYIAELEEQISSLSSGNEVLRERVVTLRAEQARHEEELRVLHAIVARGLSAEVHAPSVPQLPLPPAAGAAVPAAAPAIELGDFDTAGLGAESAVLADVARVAGDAISPVAAGVSLDDDGGAALALPGGDATSPQVMEDLPSPGQGTYMQLLSGSTPNASSNIRVPQ